MRIAFLNRGRDTHPGGDIVALDATMAALRKRGVECVKTGWDAEKIKEFDLAHIWHCNFDWSWGNYQAVVKAGKKYVLTPLFYPDVYAGVDLGQITTMRDNATRMLPFTEREQKELGRSDRSTIIPCGTDPLFSFDLP